MTVETGGPMSTSIANITSANKTLYTSTSEAQTAALYGHTLAVMPTALLRRQRVIQSLPSISRDV